MLIIKKIEKKNLEKNVAKSKNAKKIKFLKGPHYKTKTPIRWKYCENLSKRAFFRIKKNLKLAFKKLKIIGFKVWFKKKITIKSIQANSL